MGTAKSAPYSGSQSGRMSKDKRSDRGWGRTLRQLAKEHSQCPSGQSGGGLGEFSPGQMVKEFDQVVFQR